MQIFFGHFSPENPITDGRELVLRLLSSSLTMEVSNVLCHFARRLGVVAANRLLIFSAFCCFILLATHLQVQLGQLLVYLPLLRLELAYFFVVHLDGVFYLRYYVHFFGDERSDFLLNNVHLFVL